MRLAFQPLLAKMIGHPATKSSTSVSFHRLSTSVGTSVMSSREKKVADLSEEVFSKGNVHLKNVDQISALPEGLHSFPEVCFIGKPNAGKSSIISCLLHNRRLGRAGGTRGTTRLLQFFNVGDALLLVDTPGYGGWGGRRLSQNLAERARAFAILFRYLALRKRGPLKRVYWVMEAARPIQPRDEELLTFLQREHIPFSVVVSKIDRFHGDGNALRRHVEEIWQFVGSEHVPVLGVRADSKYPERCLNITALQHDITYYCTQELTRMEDLTYKGIRELSYAPPSPEDISAVERRYPVESFVLPMNDTESLERFVIRHEEVKSRLLMTSAKAALLSEKEKVENHLLSCSHNKNICSKDEKGEEFEGREGCVEGNIVNGDRTAVSLPLVGTGLPQVSNHSFERAKDDSASPPLVKKARHFRVRASLREELQRYPQNEFGLDEVGMAAPEAFAAPVSLGAHQDEVWDVFSKKETASPTNTPFALQIPPGLDANVHTVEAINGVHIPKSMITSSVQHLAAHQTGSLEWFAQRSGSGAYERLMKADVGGIHTFLESGNETGLEGDERLTTKRAHRKSMRKKHLERVLEKYISRARKERSIYMQAEGYMCPWLAGAGQPSREAVVGLVSGDSCIGRGGSFFKGLKRTGLGGKSYSAQTMKNRGRATKKTGFWAA